MRGLFLVTLLAAGFPAIGVAAQGDPQEGATSQKNVAAGTASAGTANNGDDLYGGHTDAELTELAAHWDSLDRHQRRALLTEMKLRMARKGGSSGAIHIRTERRYGRIVRQPGGQVIHIETQVVHVRPVDPDDVEDQQSFGVGFEQRIGRRHHQPDARSADADAAGEAVDSGDVPTDAPPSLNGVLESLVPSTQAPQVNRLPVYQASDPKP